MLPPTSRARLLVATQWNRDRRDDEDYNTGGAVASFGTSELTVGWRNSALWTARTALIVAALFRGRRSTSTLPNNSPRLRLDDRALLTEWKPAYKREFAMQDSLVVIGGLAGLSA